MYQIGLFSKMNRVTTKTLRHYDEKGLLKPAFIDEMTGYRYYTNEQLPILSKIIALKQMGVSLDDIKSILEEPKGAEIFLKLKEQALIESIGKQKEQLVAIQTYRKWLEGEKGMNYTPMIKSIPDVIVASVRMTVPNYDFFFGFMCKMAEEMERLGAVCSLPAYCFNIYHDGEYRDKDIDVEICEAVVDCCEDSEMIKFKEIKGYKEALCLLHKGPYDTLRDAYAYAMEWIEDNGYDIIGKARESYIDGIWNKEDASEWLTEIQFPVRVKARDIESLALNDSFSL